MGNYCSCVFSNLVESKISEIEEIKRERIKLEFENIDSPGFSQRNTEFTIYNRQEVYLKSLARYYVTCKYLSSIKIFRSFTIPCTVIYGPPPTAPEIRQIEETLDCLPLQTTNEKRI